MSEQKTVRYLKYAIGEIILVVIGILIALQINNWNEKRKSQAELNLILANLTKEFRANQKDLQNVQSSLKWTRNRGKTVLDLIGRDSTLAKDSLNRIIENSLFFTNWIPSNYVLTELNNAGKIGLIQNDSLTKLLFKWEQQIETINNWNRRLEERSEAVIDIIKKKGSTRNLNFQQLAISESSLGGNNQSLLRDIEFENEVNQKVFYTRLMEEEFEITGNIIDQILEQIKMR